MRTYPPPRSPDMPDDLVVLNVTSRDGATQYHIEPVRFELRLSRVQMVDDHLRRVCTDSDSNHPDVDVLLDARALFAQEAMP